MGFIERYTASFGQPDWAFMALKVLTKRCDLSEEEVYGGDLLEVLKEVCPKAANAFQEKLVSSTK